MFDIEVDGPFYVAPDGKKPFWVYDLVFSETDEQGVVYTIGAISLFTILDHLQKAAEIKETYPEDFNGF